MDSQSLRPSDTSELLVGGGCLLSIPLILGFGFKYALGYATKKEHEFAHQVEEVELEGAAAALLEEGLTAEQAVTRFVKKMERVTEQFEKLGGRFSQEDYDKEQARLELLQSRLKDEPDANLQQMLEKAAICLRRFPPQ